MDLAFCFTCGKAEEQGRLRGGNREQTFLTKGFCNWKDGTESLKRHEKSKCHIEAVEMMLILPKTTHNIADTLSSAHANECKKNRLMLLKIIEVLQYLGRQGISLRGHDEEESNFIQLLRLRGKDDPKIFQLLERKGSKYTSPMNCYF